MHLVVMSTYTKQERKNEFSKGQRQTKNRDVSSRHVALFPCHFRSIARCASKLTYNEGKMKGTLCRYDAIRGIVCFALLCAVYDLSTRTSDESSERETYGKVG